MHRSMTTNLQMLGGLSEWFHVDAKKNMKGAENVTVRNTTANSTEQESPTTWKLPSEVERGCRRGRQVWQGPALARHGRAEKSTLFLAPALPCTLISP